MVQPLLSLQASVPDAASIPLGKLRGQVYRYQGLPVVVSYHPTYLLRTQADKLQREGDYEGASKIRYGDIPALEKELAAADLEEAAQSTDLMVKEGLINLDFADVRTVMAEMGTAMMGTGEAGGLLVYGLRGHMFRSADFGATWQQIELKGAAGRLEFGLSNGAVLKDGSVVVVGHGGSVLKSTDKGHNFAVINRADRLSLSAVSADAKGNLILVGQGGVHVATPTGTAPQQ